RALAILVAISWNFTLNRRVSFASQRFGRPIVDQYLLWLLSSALGGAISWSVAMCLVSFTAFASHIFLAAILGIGTGSLSNFVLARYWVFASAKRTLAEAVLPGSKIEVRAETQTSAPLRGGNGIHTASRTATSEMVSEGSHLPSGPTA